jgi:hypothetical protein
MPNTLDELFSSVAHIAQLNGTTPDQYQQMTDWYTLLMHRHAGGELSDADLRRRFGAFYDTPESL